MTAAQTDKQSARRDMMLNDPIHKVIPKLAVPTIISMLITSFYNMADTFFVSMLGTAATGAAGINFSLMTLIQAAGMAYGVGAGSYISRQLGAKKDEDASRALSTAFFLSIATGAIIMLFGLIFMRPLVILMGATENVLQYSMDYASYILYAAPFMAGSFVLNQCLRSEGSATFSMIGMGVGAIVNLALDPLFIFTFHWGVAGAAAATALSQVISLSILLIPFLKKHSLLRLSPSLITMKKAIIVEIAKMGFPTLLRTGLMTVSTVVTNNVAGDFSDAALAAISVVNRFMMMIGSALIGFGQGFQPVAGFNWGAKRYDRVMRSYNFCSVVGIVGMAAICSVIAIFSSNIMMAFSKDTSVIDIGAFSIRLQCYVMPIHAWVIVVNMLFQAMGRGTSAAVLSFARQGICFIPSVIVLSLIFGVWGLAAAQAASDALSLLIALPLAIRVTREIKRLQAAQSAAAEIQPAQA